VNKLDIKGITNNSYVPPLRNVRKTNVQSSGTEIKQDKFEISNEAKILQAKSENVKDLSKIQQNIKNNVYNSDKVIEATVDGIMKELNIK